jgi:hypothetical protein
VVEHLPRLHRALTSTQEKNFTSNFGFNMKGIPGNKRSYFIMRKGVSPPGIYKSLKFTLTCVSQGSEAIPGN